MTTPAGRVSAVLIPAVLVALLGSPRVVSAADTLLSVHTAEAPLRDVCRQLSQAAGVEVCPAGAIADRLVKRLDLEGVTLQAALLALATRENLAASWGGDKWVLHETPKPAPGQIDCGLRVVEVARQDLDALQSALPAAGRAFELPGGVSGLVAALSPDLSKLLAEGRARVVVEPHVVTTECQTAALAFDTPWRPSAGCSFPDFSPSTLSQRIQLTVRTAGDGQLAVVLGLCAAWQEAGPKPTGAEDARSYTLALTLPEVTLAETQSLLLRGCPLACGDGVTTPQGWETVLMLSMRRVRDL